VDNLAQPNASRMPIDLLVSVLGTVEPGSESQVAEVVYRDQHSNDFAEVRLGDGRALIVKRARYDWAAPRFETSRIASRVIRERTGVSVPAPLALGGDLDTMPLEAYWRIELPTLQEVWPRLTGVQKRQALRSWGRLTSRLHHIEMLGAGPLSDAATPGRSLGHFLRADLGGRLVPAVTAEWPEARWIAEHLLGWVDEVDRRVGDRSRLIHNDLHMGNVLCRIDGDTVRCVGLIDLETAVAGPPEADLACMEVHHGPLFTQAIDGEWREQIRSGYSGALDEWLVNYYRALHLLNMGFYSAMIGHRWHAERVAEAASAEVALLNGPAPMAMIA
jgi:aminoglycoside phosphotransferase (APT) family kinase protein